MEKRRNRRSDLEDRVVLTYIGEPDDRHDKEISVSIVDVSENGLGFFYEKDLDIDDCFQGDVTLWTKQRINTFLKVIRKQPVEGGFHYGCIFFGMESRETMRIKIYQMLEEKEKEEPNE